MHRAVTAAAVLAGTVVRLTRTPLRYALRAVPGLAGTASLAYGAWLVYHPAGWMVAGAALLTFGWDLNRARPAPPDEGSTVG